MSYTCDDYCTLYSEEPRRAARLAEMAAGRGTP